LENNQTFAKLLKDGDVVVIWGVRQSSLPSTSQTILAYEKNADEKGERYVLMADCSSVKAMNEQEFKSAPKAGK
jgi:NADPH-dependent ferric siderophore reductase